MFSYSSSFQQYFSPLHKFGLLSLFRRRNAWLFLGHGGGAVIKKSRQLVGDQLGTLDKLLNLTRPQFPHLSPRVALEINKIMALSIL